MGLESVEPDVLHSAFTLSAILVFILGTAVGSFANVCIYRMPLAGRSVVRPTFSFCFNCGSTIAWYHNLPLISYLWLLGRCRYCGVIFSARYFWVEFLSGLIFLFLYYYYGPSLVFISTSILAVCLIIATFTDLDTYIISDEITIGGGILGFILSFIALGGTRTNHPLAQDLIVHNPFESLLGAIIGSGILFSIGFVFSRLLKKEAMGMGDIKLLGMMGAFIGPVNSVLTIFLASCLGSVFGISRILINKAFNRRHYEHIPFGPYLAVAGFFLLFVGPDILNFFLPPENLATLQEFWFGE